MKKTSILTLVVSIILTLLFIYSLFFVKTTFTVTFTNNNETVETIKVVKGETVKLPYKYFRTHIYRSNNFENFLKYIL